MLSKSDFEGGYGGLQKEIVRKLKAARIQHQVFETIERSFADILAEEGIVVSRSERKRLLAQATKSILEDMLAKLAAASGTGK